MSEGPAPPETDEDTDALARIGMWAAPVAIVHLVLLWWLVSALTGWRVPAWVHGDRVAAWLWTNGAALALAALWWRQRRFPLAPRRWLRGTRARWSILAWLLGSLLWFVAPAVVGDVLDWSGGW